MITDPEHETLWKFVQALAKATEYKSHDLGFEDSISNYWKIEAKAWVDKIEREKKEHNDMMRRMAGQCDC